MVKLTSASCALACVLRLTFATGLPAASQGVEAWPATTARSIIDLTEQPGASITQNEVQDTAIPPTTNVAASSSSEDQEILTEELFEVQSSDYELGTEVETWSFCSEGWLVPFGWIGLCPDRFDFHGINTIGTTRTVTSTLTASRRATRSEVSSQGSISTAVVTRTKLVTSTSTEMSTKANTETTTETSTEISTQIITSTVNVLSTSTVSVTISTFAEAGNMAPLTVTETETTTSTIHVPTTISHTHTGAAFPDDLTTVTVTSTSTAISTTTRMIEPTATIIRYEDGPGSDNTLCFGGAWLPDIQREGCESFYALHWTEQFMAWFLFVMRYCLILFAFDLMTKILFEWLPKLKTPGATTVDYSDPFDARRDSDASAPGPISPLPNGEGLPAPNPPADGEGAPQAPDGGEVDPQPGPGDGTIVETEADRRANTIIEEVRNFVIGKQLCGPGDPDFGCVLHMVLGEQCDRIDETDYCRAYDLIKAKYMSTTYTNADIRKKPTVVEADSGAVQRTGPQNLNEIREQIRQWGDANHDAATAQEIRTFVDNQMIPEEETDDPLFIFNACQKLVGFSGGYGIAGPVPTWRLKLEVALAARMQEHDNGEPWSLQFEGNEDLWEEKAQYDARCAPEVEKLESALKHLADKAKQEDAPIGSGSNVTEQQQVGDTEKIDPRGYDLEKHGEDYLNFVEKQLRTRTLEIFQQSKPKNTTQAAVTSTESTSTPLKVITAATEPRRGNRIFSASKLLTEIPMPPDVSPTRGTAPTLLRIEAAPEPTVVACDAESTVTAQAPSKADTKTAITTAPTNVHDALTTAEPKKVIPQKNKRRSNPMFSKGGSPANSPTTGSGSGSGFGRRKSEGKDILRRQK